jgi:hypothetical protein
LKKTGSEESKVPGKVNCREASRLLSVACERDLDSGESEALQYHLGRCLMCRNFESQLRFLRKAAKRLSSQD